MHVVEKDARWGTLYDHFGGGDAGRDACRAVGALARVGQIDTMISNFLVPLQVDMLWRLMTLFRSFSFYRFD